MKLSYISLLPLFLLSVTACRVSKDVTIPTTAIPESFRNAANDTNTIATTSWRSFFQDPGLQALIDSGLAYNNDLLIAIQNINIAQQNLKQARMSLVPAVNMNVTASTNFPSKNSLNGSLTSQFAGTDHIEDYSANIGLSWEADIWGKVRNRKRSALAVYLQSEEARKGIQTSLISTIAQTYYSILALDEQLFIAKRNLALNDSTLFVMKLQQEAGQVTMLAVQQAQAQQLAAAQLVPELEQNIQLRENALSVLTGTAPHAIARSTGLNNIGIPEQLQAGIPAQLVSNRPDVKSAELALTVANARVGLAKADFYPSLMISASGGLNSFKASNWFSIPGSLFGTAAGALAQPILQRRQIKTQYEIAKAEREKTVISFRKTVLNAVQEVSDALISIEKLDEQYLVANDRATTLRLAITNANLLFNSGMANYLEVITAQSNVLQSELALANIRLTRLNAVTNLYRALGGGWQ